MQAQKASEADTAHRKQLAREHAALFPTRLAITRWTSSNEPSHLHGAHPPLRAAWLARAQRDFQAWLDSGGFVQHDKESATAGRPGGHDGEVSTL